MINNFKFTSQLSTANQIQSLDKITQPNIQQKKQNEKNLATKSMEAGMSGGTLVICITALANAERNLPNDKKLVLWCVGVISALFFGKELADIQKIKSNNKINTSV
jgi:hypothetical protein